MKKGISPLIAWILLTGFAIALGTMIFTWATDYTRNIELGQRTSLEAFCNDVQISVPEFCINSDNQVEIDITNKGSHKISIVTFQRETNQTPLGSCLALNFNLNPQDTSIYDLSLEGNLTKNITKQDLSISVNCDTLPNQVDNRDLLYLSVVPWIEKQGEKIACVDRKVVLNEPLQRYC